MAAPGLEVVLELLGQISRLEVPVEELRALRMAVQTLPPGALREWGPEFPLSGLFNLVALGNRCEWQGGNDLRVGGGDKIQLC